MAKNIETKFEVGDWARCTEGRGWPNYINITKENVDKYSNPENIKKYSLEMISNEEEIKQAQKYFIKTVSLRKGDYLRFENGKDWIIDRITNIPEIKGDLLSMDSYISDKDDFRFLFIKTESGYEVKYFDAVNKKVSEENAKEYLKDQIKNLEKKLEISKSQSEELKTRKFF